MFSTILQCILLEYFFDKSIHYSIGPYPQLGAMLYMFHTFTPPFHIYFSCTRLGLNISEKYFTYVFILWFVIHNGLSSTLPTLCGFLSSAFSIKPSFHKLDLPEYVYTNTIELAIYLGLRPVKWHPNAVQTSLLTSMTQASIPTYTNNTRIYGIQRTMESEISFGSSNFDGKFISSIPQATVPRSFNYISQTSDTNQNKIEQLVSMGFERQNVLRALKKCHNDVEAAANELLIR